MPAVSHWTLHAQRWQHVGTPLRPPACVVRALRERVLRRLPEETRPLRALLLGVTPELAGIVWDRPYELLSVDQSEAMIASVWPGDTPERRAVRGDWFELPVTPGSIDLALGDGCLSMVDHPEGQARVGRSLERALRSGGLFAVRLFCRPERAESLERVFAALRAGEMGNFHVFKWRLAMAIQGDNARRGVRLADIWNAFRERVSEPAQLAETRGWPLAEVLTIDNYRDVDTRYSFPTLSEVRAALGQELELLETRRCEYELAERCPELLFRRR
jgi:SAM-dependent methyltransferase